jgi:hypothetical protein
LFSCSLQRNYRYFFLFIATSTFLCIFAFIFAWLSVYSQMEDNGGSMWMALRKEAYSFALIIYTSIVVWFVGGLTVFHLYLIGTNQVVYFLLLHIFFRTSLQILILLYQTSSNAFNRTIWYTEMVSISWTSGSVRKLINFLLCYFNLFLFSFWMGDCY